MLIGQLRCQRIEPTLPFSSQSKKRVYLLLLLSNLEISLLVVRYMRQDQTSKQRHNFVLCSISYFFWSSQSTEVAIGSEALHSLRWGFEGKCLKQGLG